MEKFDDSSDLSLHKDNAQGISALPQQRNAA